MSSQFPARNQVAIVGYAQTDITKHADQPLGALALGAATKAIADAGLAIDQIDGFTSSALFPSAGSHAVVDGISTVSSAWLAQRLGVNPRYASGFQGYGQMPGSVALAVNAIVSGAADYVLVHRALHNPAGSYHGNAMETASGFMQWTVPQGFFGPLAMIGLTYNEYLQRFNASPDAMANVLVEARKNGSRIPWSYWRDRPLAEQDYLDSPTLVDPIRRLDCDIPVDGCAVFILTSAERAKDLPHQPVYISGFAGGSPTRNRLPLHWPLDDVYDIGKRDGTTFVGRCRRGTGRGRSSTALRRVLALRLFLARGPRVSVRWRSASLRPRGWYRQRRPFRPPRAVRRGRPGERTHARRPSNVGVLPPILGTRRFAATRRGVDRSRMPRVATSWWRRRLQRHSVLTDG